MELEELVSRGMVWKPEACWLNPGVVDKMALTSSQRCLVAG